MKKLTFVIILSAIITHVIQAQNAGIGTSNSEKSTGDDFYKARVTEANGRPAVITAVNIKAARNFLTQCKNAENSHWYIEPNSIYVYYYINGIKGRRCYDKKGNFIFNLNTYPEDKLPYAIKDQVKSAYYFGYTILVGDEIQTSTKTIYIVHLKNKTTWLNVWLRDGEMGVLEENSK